MKLDELTVAEQLAGLAEVLLRPGTVDQALLRIVTLAASSLEHCDAASLCGVHPDDPPVASPLAARLDEAQDELAEGPCRHALAGHDTTYVGDLADDLLWPRFGVRAVELGVRSVLVLRLSSGDRTLGALQLYARLPHAFSPTARAQGLLFAAHAGMALSVAQSSAAERGRIDHLQEAMRSREVIGQAQGILMERERITADQAFDLLRRASQRLNVKLRVVAQELVDTGVVQE